MFITAPVRAPFLVSPEPLPLEVWPEPEEVGFEEVVLLSDAE